MKETAKDPFLFCPICTEALVRFHDGERLRLRCEGCGWVRFRNPTVGVAVILIEDGRLWLGRRRDGGWCIPCGHVEWDETIEEAAYREAREETGLQIELIKLFAVHSNFHNPDQHTVGVWYLASAEDTSKARPGGDLIELHPFPLNEIPALKFPTDQEVVNSLLELQNQSDS